MSESLAVVDTSQRQRVAIDTSSTITVNCNTSPVRLTNSSNQDLFSVGSNAFNGIAYGAVPEIWRTIELARQNFQTSIRSNLQFS
jgi:hypothetical protein